MDFTQVKRKRPQCQTIDITDAFSFLSQSVNLTNVQSNQLIYDIATQRKLTNDISTSLVKLSCTNGVDTITNRYYGIEVIELCHIVLTISSSCRIFLGN